MAKGYVVGSAWTENISDTVTRVHVDGHFQFGNWYQWGVAVGLYVDGSWVGGNTGYTTGSNQSTAWCSGYKDFTRRSSSYSVGWSANSWSETVDGYGGLGESDSTSGSVTIPALPVYKPDAPTKGSATRDSDTKVTLKWTNNPTTTKPYTNLKIQRKVNGGSWANVTTTLGGGTTSYVDESTSAGNYYQYQICATNSAGSSSYLSLGTVYMTPAKPTNLGWTRSGDTDVKLTMTNTTKTATALEIEYRAASTSTWSALTTVSGTVTETTVSLGGGEFYVRVRNTRGDLKSAWVTSDKIVTLVAPNAPTLVTPVSSGVISKADGTVQLVIVHNPLDGSEQTDANIRYKVGSGSWTTKKTWGTDRITINLSEIEVNSTITWQARTKGAHPDWSPWSAERTFYVRQVPTINIITPAATVTNSPVLYSFGYSDPSGSLQSATISVVGPDGVVFTKNVGTETSGEIRRDEMLLPDLQEYEFMVQVQSTSTLTAETSSHFNVKYRKPTGAALSAIYDPESGSVNLKVRPMDQDIRNTGEILTDQVNYVQFDEDCIVDNMTLFGRSSQSGTPSPTSPAPIISVAGEVQIIEEGDDGLYEGSFSLGEVILSSVPDGARDEATVDAFGHIQVTKRVGVIDLATLNWTQALNTGMWYTDELTSGVPSNDPNMPASIMAEKFYAAVDTNQVGRMRYFNNTETTKRLACNCGVGKGSPTGLLYFQLENPMTVDLGAMAPIEFYYRNDRDCEVIVYTIDEDNNYHFSLYTLRILQGGLPTETYDIQRTSNESKDAWVTLGDDLTDTTQMLDRMAPCNVDYQYRVITYAGSGAFRESYFDAMFVTPYFYLMAGNEVAKAKYSRQASEKVSCAETSLVRYAGRKYPLLYESDALNDIYSASGVVFGQEERDHFREIQRAGGKAVYKSVDGDVVHVHASTSIGQTIGAKVPIYTVGLDMDRIDGGAL